MPRRMALTGLAGWGQLPNAIPVGLSFAVEEPLHEPGNGRDVRKGRHMRRITK